MSKHGYRHVRKVNDGRPKPYFGRISFAGEEFQTKGFATPVEAHQAALELLMDRQTKAVQPKSITTIERQSR